MRFKRLPSTESYRVLVHCKTRVLMRPIAVVFSFLIAFPFPTQVCAAEIKFDDEIAPILEQRCWHCHGEDEQESGLRLDRRSRMIRGGDSGLAAVVPGEPKQSYLIEVIKHLDAGMEMPPDEDQLPADEIAVLEAWVEQGAIWPGQMETSDEKEEVDLWSFQPVQRPQVPQVTQDADQNIHSDNPVDAFLINQLASKGLNYSPVAEPQALLRRLSIVLTGLPPTPEDLQQFLRDYQQDPQLAYQSAVDRLIDSKHFGERWAQHWLDVIRWAETNGSEANLYRKNAWVYRDYVIRSFNEDKPYDQFLSEQIAGDSLGAGEATGFLVAGPHVPAATVGREPSAIRQARADRMNEIVQTVGASVMGITVGCARCHNHKFDPISIQDYYALTAIFQDVEFGGRYPEFSPEHPVARRGAELRELLDARREQLLSYGGWEENWGAYRELHFRPIKTDGIRIRFKMNALFIDELEVLGTELPDKNLASASGGTIVSGYPEKGFENRNPIQRVSDGEYGTMIWRAKVDKDEQRPWVQFDLPSAQLINRIRISNNREYFYDTDYLDKKPNLPRYEFDVEVRGEDGQWKPWTGTWAVNVKLKEKNPDRQPVLQEVQKLIAQLGEQGPRPSFVGRLIEPSVTHVLLRGSPESPRDEVDPSAPIALNGQLDLTSKTSGPERRKIFSQWVVSPENPLTARVAVNRIWHHVFGAGLVATASDFGNAGAPPTHPELLDWLASEFVDPEAGRAKPWSVKSLIRLLVTSQAFRQSSQPNDRGLAVDAASQYLWRFPPKRVEAEVIRDAVLQASGNLDETIGGRSYRIHNEKKTYAQWQVIDNHGPATWRRMIYQERMRRVDDQLFTAFDFPDCGQVRSRRPVSTTPLQALNLMNSEFVMEQAAEIAKRAAHQAEESGGDSLDQCFDLLLGRRPSESEREACAEMKDLTLVCRALINSNEFAFLP